MALHRQILVVGRSQKYCYTFCNVQDSIPSPSLELPVPKCLLWEGSDSKDWLEELFKKLTENQNNISWAFHCAYIVISNNVQKGVILEYV